MRQIARRTLSWIKSANSVDKPASSSFTRFALSARPTLWPAIVLSSFAFGHLVGYGLTQTAMLATDLCLTASIAFLFNDITDRRIDIANNIDRWFINSWSDILYACGAILAYSVLLVSSVSILSTTALIWILLTLILSIIYSLYCKKVLLLGNLVASTISISPGLIILIDAYSMHPLLSDSATVMIAFLSIAFLFLVSREIKFDEYDIVGDRIGGRVTLPMFVSARFLSVIHGLLVFAALFVLFVLIYEEGRLQGYGNLVLSISISIITGWLLFRAYRSCSKETFYRTTRLVMLVVPISIFIGF